MTYDACIIGGGIVGLATAMKFLEQRPGSSLVLLEKEGQLGYHQTGHNSGVIHSGIYYAPGSLKADLCKRGAAATKEFCARHGIPFIVCGKLLVATNALEMQRMDALFERAGQNGIAVERLTADELAAAEPNIRGLGALRVRSTAIVDYRLVCEAMGRTVTAGGGEIALNAAVTAIREEPGAVTVVAGDRSWSARRVVNCGGLQSDRLAEASGLRLDYQIVPFRGEYYRLPASRHDLIQSLIYPVPDPGLPFLGIHLTRMIDGGITVGPNAVIALAREGYEKFSFNARDVARYATFPGFWRVVAQHRRSAATEVANSLRRNRYLKECQKYCPSLTLSDLVSYTSGVRAQAVTRAGALLHDFFFLETKRVLHVCNAPSPAATSAIPIGEMIAQKSLGLGG
jgi:L-2-hydroxyglutarate oxidase